MDRYPLALRVLIGVGLGLLALAFAFHAMAGEVDVLAAINKRVNHETRPLRVPAWENDGRFVPGPAGDCRTFVANKIEALAAVGLQPGRIMLVRTETGEGHAVLVVGELIMDSRFDRLMTWPELVRLGYRSGLQLVE